MPILKTKRAAMTKFNLEQALKELTDITEKMEQGDLELEVAMQQFEQGVKLIRQCQSTLKDAEQKVQILTETSDNLELEPYATA